MNNKLFFAIGLAATLLQAPVTVSAQSSGTSQQNPLLMKSNLPFGAPDFSRIKESDYLPAIEAAIKIKRDNIQKIVDNKKKPTFQNTILAFEESGILLDRALQRLLRPYQCRQDSRAGRSRGQGDAVAHGS